MTTQDDIREIWTAVEKIREHAESIKTSAARLEAQVAMHISDKSIHQRSPCEYVKALGLRFWGFVVIVIGALFALVAQTIVRGGGGKQ